MEMVGLIMVFGQGICRGLIAQYCKSEFGKEFLDQLADSGFARLKSGAEKTDDAKLLKDAADAVVRDLKPLFDNAPGVDHAAVVYAAAWAIAHARLDARGLVEQDLDTGWVASSLFDDAVKSNQGLGTANEEFLRDRLLPAIAERIVDAAHLLRGGNSAVHRAVLERFSATLHILAEMRDEQRSERGEAIRFFENRYFTEIRSKYNRLDHIGLKDVNNKLQFQSLVVSYVSLNVEQAGAGRSGSIMSAEQMLGRSERLVVVGDAGAGKTTLLQWVAVQAASPGSKFRPSGWGEIVPFFLRLRDLPGGQFPGAADFVPLTVANAVNPPDTNWVLRQLDSGRALVLIDGVDELSEQKREAMLTGLSTLVEQFPLARYVVSSRPHALDQDAWEAWSVWTEREGFTRVTLRPMGMPQIREFIDHWHAATQGCYTAQFKQEKQWDTLPRRLKDLLIDQPTLAVLAETPLLCGIICALHVDYGEQMPTNRKDLYDQCLTMLLSDRDALRNITVADLPKLGQGERRDLARALAYHMMDLGEPHIAVDDVDTFFDQEVEHWDTSDIKGSGIRRLFCERCSLLSDPIEGRVAFRHKTFQEFLAAEYAIKRHFVKQLASRAPRSEWRETIIVAAEMFHREDAEQLLLAMVARPSSISPIRYTTALACLANARVSKDARQSVVDACRWLFPPTLQTAADVAAGGEPAVPLLIPVATMDPATRAACVLALAKIGTKSALSAIEAHAHAEAFVASHASEASWLDFIRVLGEAWDAFNAADYAGRVLGSVAWTALDSNGPSPFQGEGWGGVAVVPTLDLSDPWNRVAALIGDGRPPQDIGTGRQWWAVWLAAQIAADRAKEAPDADAETVSALRNALVALIEAAAVLPPPERALCGRVLSHMGDPRPGVGLRPDGLPDIAWCDVAAGEFLYGSDKDKYPSAYDDETPQVQVTLPSFWIAKYPVTYLQFQAFIKATDGYCDACWWNGLHEEGRRQQSGGPGEQAFQLDNHPREGASWYDAMAFCRWLSAGLGVTVTLPTEHQWEKAARGTDGRIYPYGEELAASKGNTWETGIRQTSAVGAFPDSASPCGAMDMSGNVWEWTLTEYENRSDANVGSDARRAVRGGSWPYFELFAGAASRFSGCPVFRVNYFGFRLACPANPS